MLGLLNNKHFALRGSWSGAVANWLKYLQVLTSIYDHSRLAEEPTGTISVVFVVLSVNVANKSNSVETNVLRKTTPYFKICNT